MIRLPLPNNASAFIIRNGYEFMHNVRRCQ